MIDVSGRGLELGPLDRPIMAKRDGFDVQIVDYLDTEALREKYNSDDHPDVDPSAIEEVDFVSHGESLSELIGEEGVFDWVLASHVIEHIPDLVTFLQDVARILRPDGRLGAAGARQALHVRLLRRAQHDRSGARRPPRAPHPAHRRARRSTTSPARPPCGDHRLVGRHRGCARDRAPP